MCTQNIDHGINLVAKLHNECMHAMHEWMDGASFKQTAAAVVQTIPTTMSNKIQQKNCCN